MKKYYNKVIPTEIHFVYGGRYAGKTYREFEKLKTRINELEEKNKKLKEKYDLLVKENRGWYERWKKLLNRIYEALEYIHNNQPVFELSSKKQLQEWFEKEYYVRLLKILNGKRK